ncbi:unnamed protein product [Lupinus luteus]|uniref:Uncharacterized protein n=1 Tax=Lupinus luteus TaxID=3873 RepID=A0AAV1WHM9_LUPLU
MGELKDTEAYVEELNDYEEEDEKALDSSKLTVESRKNTRPTVSASGMYAQADVAINVSWCAKRSDLASRRVALSAQAVHRAQMTTCIHYLRRFNSNY